MNNNTSSPLIFINGANSRRARSLQLQEPQGVPSTTTSQPQPPSLALKNHLKDDAEHVHKLPIFTASELDNLRLMRHFCTHVWHSVAPEPDYAARTSTEYLWRDIVPDLALSHPLLLHALLAVSAVHLELTKKDSNFTFAFGSASMANLARQHHSESLSLMQDALNGPMDNTTIPPVFAASALIAMYAFGHSLTANHSAHFGDQNPIESFAQALTMLRGMSAVVCSQSSLLEKAPFKTMLPPEPTSRTATINPAAEGYIATLKAVHASMRWIDGQEQAEGYSRAIEFLRDTFLLHAEDSVSQGSMVPFAVRMPEQVLLGIREQQPLALCLIAGYATVLHWLRSHLWIQGWGRRVIDGVETILKGNEWQEVIAWPLRVVRNS